MRNRVWLSRTHIKAWGKLATIIDLWVQPFFSKYSGEHGRKVPEIISKLRDPIVKLIFQRVEFGSVLAESLNDVVSKTHTVTEV